MADKIFAKGLYYKLPRPGAPDFVKGAISIKALEFIEFLQRHEKNGWVNLDFLKSKPTEKNPDGVYYFSLDDYEKPADSNYNEPEAPAHPF